MFEGMAASDRVRRILSEVRELSVEEKAELETELLAMDRATPLVFQCHHGMRSLQAAEQFVRKGFRYVYNLNGGIDGWSASVDPSVPRY